MAFITTTPNSKLARSETSLEGVSPRLVFFQFLNGDQSDEKRAFNEHSPAEILLNEGAKVPSRPTSHPTAAMSWGALISEIRLAVVGKG